MCVLLCVVFLTSSARSDADMIPDALEGKRSARSRPYC